MRQYFLVVYCMVLFHFQTRPNVFIVSISVAYHVEKVAGGKGMLLVSAEYKISCVRAEQSKTSTVHDQISTLPW